MSFTGQVKEELCNTKELYSHCKIALLRAFLNLGSVFIEKKDNPQIIFKTTNQQVSILIGKLLKELYSIEVEFSKEKQNYLNREAIYLVTISDQSETIIEEFSLLDSRNVHDDIENNNCCITAYLRGAFLVKGSVNDPKTSAYHLELIVSNNSEAVFIQRLMNIFELNAKIGRRRNKLIVYLKEAQSIMDFLRRIGTIKAVFDFEEIIIERTFNADIKRIMNCEIANETKTINAAKEQLRYIRYLEYNYPLEKIEPKILFIMKVRKDNPEASFVELLDIIKQKGEVLTKSGLNHRFRKIKELVIKHQLSKQRD